MGTVYKALHTKLKRVVALKVLPAEKIRSAQAIARFEREMEAVGKLDHPNIVRASDAGEADGTHFLVMEYVKGLNLSELVRRHGPLPNADACELVRQAAVGLEHAREHGMVHRDVKPSNLILSSEGVVKILDLGLALLSRQHAGADRELTSTGQMMGTLDYMAPEQGSDSHEVDIRADIYSLGASLFKLLCGEPPFSMQQNRTPLKLMMAKGTEPAPSIATRRDDLPAELVAIVDRMLATKPDDRFATPREVADALAPFAERADLPALLGRVVAPLGEPEQPATGSPAYTSQSAATDEHLSSGSAETAPTMEPAPDVDVDRPGSTGSARTDVARPTLRRIVAIAAALGGIVLFGVVILLFRAEDGTIVVEINDPEIRVTVDGGKITITKDKSGEPITLEPGPHSLVVKRGGLEFATDEFTLRKGERVVLSVKLVKGQIQVVRDDKVIVSKPQRNYALAFDGKASFVEVPTLKYDGTHPITLETWVTVELTENNACLISISQTGLSLSPQERGFSMIGRGPGGREGWVWAGAEDAFPIGKRCHLAGVWDGQHIVIFANGRRVAAYHALRGFSPPAGQATLFGKSPAYARWLRGAIDEIRISNVARYTKDFTPAERFQPDNHTLALYHFDEGSGDLAHDASGNKHHGKIVGAKWMPAERMLGSDPAHSPDGGDAIDLPALVDPKRNVLVSPAENVLPGIIPRPTKLLGIRRWQIATVAPPSIVSSIAWSPSGRQFACGTATGYVRVYDTDTLRLVQLLIGHQSSVEAVAWSPDGKRLASGSLAELRLWDSDGTPGLVLEGHTGIVSCIVWSPNGKRLASACPGTWPRTIDATVRLWDSDGTPGPVLEAFSSSENFHQALAWSPDGKWLAAINENSVRLWDSVGTPGQVLEGHTDDVYSIVWSPDSKHLASGSWDGTVRLWNVDGTAGPLLEGHTAGVFCIDWSPDGKQLASGSGDKTVRLWAADGTPGPVLEGHDNTVKTAAWSPDGEHLVSACYLDNAVRLWTADGRPAGLLKGDASGAWPVVWSPDGKRLLLRCQHDQNYDAVQLCGADFTPQQELRAHNTRVLSVKWSPDRKRLASGVFDGTVRLWDSDGRQTAVLKGHTAPVPSVDWSPDGKRLASGSHDGTVRLWNADGKPGPAGPVLAEDGRAVASVAWSPNGEVLAAAKGHKALLWDAADGTASAILEGHTSDVYSLAWSPDGKQLASGSGDKTVRLWAADGTPGAVLTGQLHFVKSVAWSSDGKRLASAGHDAILRVWDSQGTPELVLRGHTRPTFCVDWSPDGKRLASAGQDSVLRLWDVWAVYGRPGSVLGGHVSEVYCVDWRPAAGQILSGRLDGTLRLWAADTAAPLWVAVPLRGGKSATFSAAGQFLHGDPEVLEKEFVYLIETDSGRLELLTPSAFHRRVTTKAARHLNGSDG